MKRIKTFIKKQLDFYVCVFFLCCVAGWCIEVVFRTLKAGWLIFPGFMYGCYLPLYGFGALIMVAFFENATDKKLNVFSKLNIMPLVIFACSTILLSIMEYITHFALENYLNIELWSYTTHNFNLNGRVSLKQSVMFGGGGTVFIYSVYPVLKRLLLKVTPRLMKIAATTIAVVIIAEFILSVKKALLC